MEQEEFRGRSHFYFDEFKKEAPTTLLSLSSCSFFLCLNKKRLESAFLQQKSKCNSLEYYQLNWKPLSAGHLQTKKLKIIFET